MLFKNSILFAAIVASTTLSTVMLQDSTSELGQTSPVVADEDNELDYTNANQHILNSKTTLGVHVSEVNDAMGTQLGLPENIGLLIEHVVENSAASKAGLKKHDVLHKVNDQLLINSDQLATLIQMSEIDANVVLTIVRNGASMQVPATLIARPANRVDLTVQGFDAFKHYHGKQGMKEFQNCSVCHASSADEILKDSEFDNYKFFHGKSGPKEFQNCSNCHKPAVRPLEIKKAM